MTPIPSVEQSIGLITHLQYNLRRHSARLVPPIQYHQGFDGRKGFARTSSVNPLDLETMLNEHREIVNGVPYERKPFSGIFHYDRHDTCQVVKQLPNILSVKVNINKILDRKSVV